MLSNAVMEAASAIGAFYLQKNNGDYEAAKREITDLHISKIEVDDKLPHSKTIIITAARVGMLIGRRAINYEALEKFLGTKIKVIEDEDALCDYLIPRRQEWY